MTPASIEQRIAKIALEKMARSVSTSLSEYQKWFVAGLGAAVGLVLPKLHQLAQLVGDVRAVVVVGLLCAAIVMAVVALFLGAQVLAATAVTPEMETAAQSLTQGPQAKPDVEVIFAEMRRGLWWPALWGFDYGRRAAESGDHVAPSRLVAQLSQIQAYLVIIQVLMILAAVIIGATAAL